MPKVFVINEPATSTRGPVYDVSSAAAFGDLVFVFEKNCPRPGSNIEWSIDHVHDVLEDMTEEDYLIWAGGDPMCMVIVASVMADKIGSINYLSWQRSLGSYHPLKLQIFDGEENDNGY